MTMSGFCSSMSLINSSTLSAFTQAVEISVLVVGASFSASASHFDFVRLAMHILPKTSLFWQHLCIATEATAPQPIIRAFFIFLFVEVKK